MKTIMMTVAILGVLGGIGYFFFQQLPGKSRSRMGKKGKQPSSSNNVKDLYQKLSEDEDSDTILGIKPEPAKPIPSTKPIASNENSTVILSCYLIAPENKPYVGYELLQSLLGADLRHGAMDIFHYYDVPSQQNLFSVATVNKPGTFDLNNFGGFSCNGLALFMTLHSERNHTKALETMLAIAQQLHEDLGGELRDNTKQPLSAEKIAQYREQIHAYEEGRVSEIP
ncbi:MAG TPA: cell division protein ZipA C-terminal FtsZ-binding domain-containing protein [Coxiellaceae bacterium]|nr:cell division protein ZipA C-terminal FtsZ-binding domain-containing protein [Coxiellaceae bacterium]